MVMLPSGQPASKGQLTIERLACHINLPGSIEDAASVAGRIERMAYRDVARACSEHLDWPDEEAVYRIRHLHLSLWLDKSAMSTGDVSRRWGGLLATAIMRSVRSGGSRDVVRFASPRHFVTAFLRDIVDGVGWEKWYYEEFRYLRRLPIGSVAAQLLAARPDWILPSMAELQRTGHAPRLLARMTIDDLSRLWSALDLPEEPGPGLLLSTRSSDHGMLSQLMSRWSSVALSYGHDRRSRVRDRFVMLLAAARDSIVDARDHYAAAVIHAVLDLIALSRMAPDLAMMLMMRSELYPQAIQRIASSPLADMLNWLVPLSQTPEGRERLSALAEAASTIVRPRPFTNGDSDFTTAAARDDKDMTEPPSPATVTGEMDQGGERGGSGGEQSELEVRVPDTSGEDSITAEIHRDGSRAALTSPVGSIFLLAPALAETRLWEYWLAEHGEETAREFIFALALKALGRSRAPLYLDDVMLASFAGLDQPPVATSRTRADTDKRPETWPAAIPEIAARWYPEIDRDLTEGTAEGLEVIRDNKASFWLAAWPAGRRDEVDSQAIYQMLLSRQSGSPRRMTDAEQSALEAEATHFQLGQRVGFPWLTPSVDAALSTAASLVLRRTAARLPRMGQSSPSYLATQFLAQPATVHFDNVSAAVELSSGPLGIVLRLAALPELIHAPWLSRPVSLRVASESGQS